jgi:hypothetical protein
MACNPNTNEVHEDLDYLPAKGFALLKINNLSALHSDLKNNHFLNACKNISLYKNVADKVAPLAYLETNEGALLGFYSTAHDSVSFLLAAAYTPHLFDPGKAANFSQESLNYPDITLQRYVIDGKTFYGAKAGKHWLLSDSDSLIRIAYNAPGDFSEEEEFKTLYATSDRKRNATFFINMKDAAHLCKNVLRPDAIEKLGAFSEWLALDLGTQQDYFGLNGIALPSSSVGNFVILFRHIRPLPLQSPAFAPENAKAITAYAINGYQKFAANRIHYTADSIMRDSLFDAVEELGLITDNFGTCVVLNTLGAENISTHLARQRTGSFTYQDREIYTLNNTDLLSDYFSPLVDNFNAGYYTLLENAVVFADNEASLSGLIDHYSLEKTFNKTAQYNASLEYLADESNSLILTGDEGILELLDESLHESFLEELKKVDLSGYSMSAQLVAEGGFYHNSLMLKRLGSASTATGVNPVYTVRLDAPLASDPQFVINHRTNKKEIAVQDENNKLYLISTEGKVLWKKPLGGPIQGSVSQVDLYRNGRLQLAFTTDNQFLILDRNGREVTPFDMDYPEGNLNPLAVFDYENNRNYRFVVTQGDKIFMYNNNGKIVRGFKYTRSEGPVINPPSHIRFGNRDYLVFQLEDGTLKILNRIGSNRIKVNEKIDFSGNGVFAYQNQFALTDKLGTLYLIDEKGEVSKSEHELNQDHGMEATSKSMAFMNDNILNIKGRELHMDYGVYSSPRIFYIYDTIYVNVTDLQSGKTYLFNSSAEPIAGFPVSGNSPADLADIDNDRTLEMVVRTKPDTFTLYRINR